MSYSLTGRKTGKVQFQGVVSKETETRSSKMTANAIEGGGSITDHVSLNPEQLQIAGVVVKDLESTRKQLELMWLNRDLVSYVGRIRVTDYVLLNLQFVQEARNKKGFSFTATLQKANIVSGEYVDMGAVKLMSQQDKTSQEKVKASGLKTTVSKSISESSYAAYVNSYNGKSSSGPSQRASSGYDGVN